MLTCAERSSASSHTGLRPLVDGAACCISSASEASLSSVSARKAAGVRSSHARGCLSASHGNSACRFHVCKDLLSKWLALCSGTCVGEYSRSVVKLRHSLLQILQE